MMDLVRWDFFLLPKMKLKLRGRHFEAVEEIEGELQVEQRPEHWEWCITDYFEGNVDQIKSGTVLACYNHSLRTF